MTWDRSRYPPNWEEIAEEVKAEAGYCCENCDAPDGPPPHVLTVHHLDMDPQNVERENLVALCQRCHLHVQATYRPGQLAFWPEPWLERRMAR